MTAMVTFLIQISGFAVIYLLVLIVSNKIIGQKSKRLVRKMSLNFEKFKRYNLFGTKYIIIILITVLSYIVSFILIHSLIKVWLASLFLSIPVLIVPFLILKINEIKEKNRILKWLPIYALNLKNNIQSDNNIILAIKKTKVEATLRRHVDTFINEVNRGINVYEAFNKLDKSVNLPSFSELIHAFKMCYKNGGDFSIVLDMYSKQTTEKLLLNEREREKSMSTMITLIVMIALNVMMLFMYMPKNTNVLEIFSGNILGRALIDANSITTLLCVYLLYKIYKMEE